MGLRLAVPGFGLKSLNLMDANAQGTCQYSGHKELSLFARLWEQSPGTLRPTVGPQGAGLQAATTGHMGRPPHSGLERAKRLPTSPGPYPLSPN